MLQYILPCLLTLLLCPDAVLGASWFPRGKASPNSAPDLAKILASAEPEDPLVKKTCDADSLKTVSNSGTCPKGTVRMNCQNAPNDYCISNEICMKWYLGLFEANAYFCWRDSAIAISASVWANCTDKAPMYKRVAYAPLNTCIYDGERSPSGDYWHQWAIYSCTSDGVVRATWYYGEDNTACSDNSKYYGYVDFPDGKCITPDEMVHEPRRGTLSIQLQDFSPALCGPKPKSWDEEETSH